MAKLLICDEDPLIRERIGRYARLEGHATTETAGRDQALMSCKMETFDMIIMDIESPGEDGTALLPEQDGLLSVREMRKITAAPIIIVSARTEESIKLLLFEYGVDDYVEKPFSAKELMCRVSAILRRCGLNSEKKAGPDRKTEEILYSKEGLLVDIAAYKVMVDGEQINLTAKLYELLFLLIRNRNIFVSRDKILTEVWGFESCSDERTLDTHMKMLRKKMGPYAALITTLRGVGYKFEG